MISVIIADDEALARDELSYLLKKHEDIDIVGEASQGTEALKKIQTLKPNVAFLDIHMPHLDGLTLAQKLLEQDPNLLIVFATAFDQHAIQAFEVNAVDYLLKPFDEERVSKTVERIRERLKNPKSTFQNGNLNLNAALFELLKSSQNPKVSKLAVQNEEGIFLINPRDILYIYRENRDVFIQTLNKVYSTKYTLQTLEEKLASYPFFRVHRSYIVNLKYVQELIPWFNGAYTIILSDEKRTEVPVSRAYSKPLKDALEI